MQSNPLIPLKDIVIGRSSLRTSSIDSLKLHDSGLMKTSSGFLSIHSFSSVRLINGSLRNVSTLKYSLAMIAWTYF
jgi:hypothetical protein